MPKNAYITARVDEDDKAKAQKVLKSVGLSTTDAISLFLKQIVLHDGLPFEVRIPNAETRAAMREARARKGERFTGSTKEAFAKVLGSDK